MHPNDVEQWFIKNAPSYIKNAKQLWHEIADTLHIHDKVNKVSLHKKFWKGETRIKIKYNEDLAIHYLLNTDVYNVENGLVVYYKSFSIINEEYGIDKTVDNPHYPKLMYVYDFRHAQNIARKLEKSSDPRYGQWRYIDDYTRLDGLRGPLLSCFTFVTKKIPPEELRLRNLTVSATIDI